MDTGLILALISSVSFAASVVLARKTAGEAGESFSVTAISIFIGVPFFTIAIFASGDWTKLQTISWQALAMLASAGIIHFIFGRLLAYNSFRLIGANRASNYTVTTGIYTVLFSIIFLGEAVTFWLWLGVFCMFAGAALITVEKNNNAGEKRKLSRNEIKGIFMALGAALCWGVTPILIKPSIEEISSSVAGAFISYASAAVVMGLLFINRSNQQHLMKLPFKKSVLPMVIAGIFAASGQLLYYTALGKSPASIIIPLVSIQIIFILILSWLINRKIELFTPKIILGVVATLTGTVLLFQ